MKIRDWAFAILLVVCVALALRPSAPPERARSGFIGRVIEWVAMWWVVGDEPPPAQGDFQDAPQWVLNAPPDRTPGHDGFVSIDNGDGW